MKNPKSPILLHYTTLFVVLSSLSLPPFISFPLCSSSSSSQPNRSIFLQTPLPFLSQLSFPHNPKSGFSFFVCCFFPLFFFTFTPFSTDYCVFPFFLNIFFFFILLLLLPVFGVSWLWRRMSGGGSRASIPNCVRKTIENIKEITGNHSDDEIYAMLKECSMDPNETAQKLLLQGTFFFFFSSLFCFY